jgi:hypothetical protein
MVHAKGTHEWKELEELHAKHNGHAIYDWDKHIKYDRHNDWLILTLCYANILIGIVMGYIIWGL